MGSTKNFGIFNLNVLIIIFGAVFPFPAVILGEIECPAKEAIAPCECYFVDSFNETYVTCTGRLVTQQLLNNLILELRRTNNLSNPEDVLEFGQLIVDHFPSITTLDLTPFLTNRLKVNNFAFSSSNNLTSIVGPPFNSTDQTPSPTPTWTPIEAGKVKLAYFRMNDEGFGESLKYFNSSVMWLLDVSGSDLEGKPGPELLPGLSSLTELTNLDLSANVFKEISGGPFRRMSKMINLNLAYFIRREEPIILGDDAFLFDSVESDSININLHANRLQDKDFNNHNIGIINSNRTVRLGLGVNYFQFLSQENFEPFLQANNENGISLDENYLICDEKMSWLKNGTNEYRSRVDYTYCVNDHGLPVWETDLIP